LEKYPDEVETTALDGVVTVHKGRYLVGWTVVPINTMNSAKEFPPVNALDCACGRKEAAGQTADGLTDGSVLDDARKECESITNLGSMG
jgi:hypothetical protein